MLYQMKTISKAKTLKPIMTFLNWYVMNCLICQKYKIGSCCILLCQSIFLHGQFVKKLLLEITFYSFWNMLSIIMYKIRTDLICKVVNLSNCIKMLLNLYFIFYALKLNCINLNEDNQRKSISLLIIIINT